VVVSEGLARQVPVPGSRGGSRWLQATCPSAPECVERTDLSGPAGEAPPTGWAGCSHQPPNPGVRGRWGEAQAREAQAREAQAREAQAREATDRSFRRPGPHLAPHQRYRPSGRSTEIQVGDLTDHSAVVPPTGRPARSRGDRAVHPERQPHARRGADPQCPLVALIAVGRSDLVALIAVGRSDLVALIAVGRSDLVALPLAGSNSRADPATVRSGWTPVGPPAHSTRPQKGFLAAQSTVRPVDDPVTDPGTAGARVPSRR
jgi:hypothetical protein